MLKMKVTVELAVKDYGAFEDLVKTSGGNIVKAELREAGERKAPSSRKRRYDLKQADFDHLKAIVTNKPGLSNAEYHELSGIPCGLTSISRMVKTIEKGGSFKQFKHDRNPELGHSRAISK